jgi:hypothetical protein
VIPKRTFVTAAPKLIADNPKNLRASDEAAVRVSVLLQWHEGSC